MSFTIDDLERDWINRNKPRKPPTLTQVTSCQRALHQETKEMMITVGRNPQNPAQ